MIIDRFDMTDRVAVISWTGGPVGIACALAMAEAGADVVVCSNAADELERVATAVVAAGRRARVVVADVTDEEVAANLPAEAAAAFGRLDVVIADPGAWPPGRVMDLEPEAIGDAFRRTVASTHALVRASVPHLLASGGGSIVTVGSGGPGGTHHLGSTGATAALALYTRQVARELAPAIRVNAVVLAGQHPSAVASELRISTEWPASEVGSHGEDVAAAVLYLASPGSAHCTGACLWVGVGRMPMSRSDEPVVP